MLELQNKQFQILFSEKEILHRVEEIASEINLYFQSQKLVLVIAMDGAFRFSSALLQKLNCVSRVEFARCKSYDGITQSADLKWSVQPKLKKGEKVLIVEDIVDSGMTLEALHDFISARTESNIYTTSLLFKPKALVGKHKPLFVGFEIPNQFVVGFGMDVDNYGRELNAIYQNLENNPI